MYVCVCCVCLCVFVHIHMYMYTEASEDEAGAPKETVSHARDTLTRLKQVRLWSVCLCLFLCLCALKPRLNLSRMRSTYTKPPAHSLSHRHVCANTTHAHTCAHTLNTYSLTHSQAREKAKKLRESAGQDINESRRHQRPSHVAHEPTSGGGEDDLC